jgi:transposase
MNQHRRFTKEFAAEAVALLHSSGRTRRQVADDLGIGLSTLARWSRDRRDRGNHRMMVSLSAAGAQRG